MASNLDQLIKEINKKHGPNTINRATDFENLEVEYVSTGSAYLDWAIGKGIPRGKIIELYGIPSSGKSLISSYIVAEAQRRGEECVWFDCENSFDPSFAETLGIDVDKLIISQVSLGETTMDLVKETISKGQPSIVVVDSVAAMIPRSDLEESLEQATMATRARMMSRGLAQINAVNKNTIVIFINQLRTDLGAYGGPSVTTGGRALGFYASVRIEVKRGDFIEQGKQKIGQVIKFRIVKNKVAPPFKEGYFKFLYEGKIDKADEMVSLALLNGKIQQGGAWFSFQDKRFQGREAFEEELKKDKDFYDSLKKEVFK